MAIFAELAACKDSGASADSAEAQALVAKLQAHITASYYTCTDEILSQVLARCTLPTSGSRRILTSMVKEPPYLLRKL